MKFSARHLLASCGVALAGTVCIRATLPEYAPYPPDQKPGAIATKLSETKFRHSYTTRQLQLYGAYTLPTHAAVGFHLLEKAPADDGLWLDMNTNASQRIFSIPIPGSPVAGFEACAADLNGDGVLDFMVVGGTGGCGLAADIRVVTFLLSAPAGYVARYLHGYDIGPTDLVRFGKDERPVLLHTMFVAGESGKDGLVHNYWVHNLLGFSGTQLVSANARVPGYPKWIWYKFKPNHDATDQLTVRQKRRLWREAFANDEHWWERITWIPLGRLLADEQR